MAKTGQSQTNKERKNMEKKKKRGRDMINKIINWVLPYIGWNRDFVDMDITGVQEPIQLPIYDSEHNKITNKEDALIRVTEIFKEEKLHTARMICSSKTTYRVSYPDNIAFFNCNILLEGWGKVWFGDLDVTRDKRKLIQVASKLRQPLYLFRESDARFGKEDEAWETLKPKAVAVIIPE
jgi:hypothetical protein